MKINDTDKKNVSSAIKKAELKTSGEIVPVLLSKSDFYPAAHFRLAIMVSILTSLVSYYCYDFLDPIFLIWIQVPGLILGYLLAYIPVLKRLFSTKREMQEEVYQRAVEIFHNHHVSMTKDRVGIMIFISVLERRVEVLADYTIDQKLGTAYWEALIKKLTEKIKEGHTVDGLVGAIEECGESLNELFPIQSDDINEVSNELITDL